MALRYARKTHRTRLRRMDWDWALFNGVIRMSNPYTSDFNNNFINNRSNGRRRRNFNGSMGSVGSIPSTDYELPQTFQTGSIDFPKAPSLGQFTPSNSGIKRDWSGSELTMPSKNDGIIGESMEIAKDITAKRQVKLSAKRADRADRANAQALGEEVESEEDNPAPRRRRDGSEIKPFPKFDSFDDDYSAPTSSGGATSYDEETGELMMDLESPWTTRDTGRAAKEVGKLAGRAAKKVGTKIYQKGKERFSKGGGNSSQFDTPDFDDPFA
jgi:hypothetical protein